MAKGSVKPRAFRSRPGASCGAPPQRKCARRGPAGVRERALAGLLVITTDNGPFNGLITSEAGLPHTKRNNWVATYPLRKTLGLRVPLEIRAVVIAIISLWLWLHDAVCLFGGFYSMRFTSRQSYEDYKYYLSYWWALFSSFLWSGPCFVIMWSIFSHFIPYYYFDWVVVCILVCAFGFSYQSVGLGRRWPSSLMVLGWSWDSVCVLWGMWG